MKTNRKQLRALLEELTAREEFMQSMEKDRGRAGQHLDDLLAREQGYGSYLDKSVEDMISRIDRENELEDKFNQMAREEVGVSSDYVPSENIEFMRHKKAAEEALAKGDDEEFTSRYQRMVQHGSMFDISNPDAWKAEPGVDRLMAAMNELESQGSLFDLANSPVLRSLGIMENKTIKISRRQLRKLVEQASEEGSDLTDEKQKEIDDAVADYLASEGGAASEEGTEKVVSDKVDGVDAKAYLTKKERFKQLTVGNDPQDYYDTTLAEVQSLIIEELEKIGFYKKYSYGLDDIPNQTKAHDDIIGHT